MMRVLGPIAALGFVGCGRLAFDPVRDAAPAPDGGFDNPVVLAVPAGVDPQLSADALELWMTVIGTQGKALALLTRATPNESFGAPTIEPLFDSALDDVDGALTADNLVFMYVQDFRLLLEARRATPTDAWSPPAQVAGIGTSTVYSFDLSPDGLVIYYEAGDMILRRASRANRASPFGPPEAITAPSMAFPTVSPDELLLFANTGRFEPTSTLWAARSRIDEPFVDQGTLALGTNCRDPDISPTGSTLVLVCNEAAYMLTR